MPSSTIDRMARMIPADSEKETAQAWRRNRDASRLMRTIRDAAHGATRDKETREELAARLASRVFGIAPDGGECDAIGTDDESLADGARKELRAIREDARRAESVDAITAQHGGDAIARMMATIPDRADHRGDAYLSAEVDPRPEWIAELDAANGARSRGITRAMLTSRDRRYATRVTDGDLARVWDVSLRTVQRSHIDLALVDETRRRYRESPDADADGARRNADAMRALIEGASYTAPTLPRPDDGRRVLPNATVGAARLLAAVRADHAERNAGRARRAIGAPRREGWRVSDGMSHPVTVRTT